MKRFILSISAGICLLFAGQVKSDIPKQMNYQGILSGSTGNPLADSTVDVEFRIYDSPAGGNSKWVETQTVTTDEQGRFNVLLGLVTPIEDTVFNGIDRYLSINVESNGELPRLKLTSAAYSNRVSTVDGSKGGFIAGGTVIAGSGPDDLLVLDVGDPNVALELRSGTFGGQPFIDFVNDAVSDRDARIQLQSDNGLEIKVDSTLNVPTGLVGLGTTAPEARLHVRGGSPARGIIIENTAATNSDDIRIKRPGAESAGSPRFSFSQRFNNTDFWLYGYDGTTFKNFLGFNYATNVVASPADGNNLYVDNANSKVGMGTSSPGSQTGLENVRLEVADEDGLLSDFALRVAGTSGSAGFDFVKSRGSLSSPAIVQDGDLLGNIVFLGHDGSDFGSFAAWIRAAVDGTPGSNDMPGRLQFMTTPDGSVTPSVRMTIKSNGNVGIGALNPNQKLYVAGNATVSDTLFASNVSSLSPLQLQTAGTTRIYVDDATGNVGVGTISPAAKLEVAGSVKIGTGGTAIGRVLRSTAPLNFPGTGAGAESDLTMTVTGAAVGDAVSIGVPSSSVVSGGAYTAWVSSPSTVTIRFFCYLNAAGADPAIGTFQAVVMQF